MEQQFAELLSDNASKWNEWRKNNSKQVPTLRNINFLGELMRNKENYYDLPAFHNVDFSDVDFNMASLRSCSFIDCSFDRAKLTYTDLVDAYFANCSFINATMRVSKIGSATFSDCLFEQTDMSYCSAQETSFECSNFIEAILEHVKFVDSDFSGTELIGCRVYGISSWDLNLTNSSQKNLVITRDEQPEITVDNIELAQFMYLMISNEKLRNIIDTITSKVVLILGRFSYERKVVLDEVRERLRHYNYIPVMYDFEKPSSRNSTETVYTLASMARFVIADLTSPRSLPHELATIVPRLPSVTFYPMILNGEEEYGMFVDFLVYKWVKPIETYEVDSIHEVLTKILNDQNQQTH